MIPPYDRCLMFGHEPVAARGEQAFESMDGRVLIVCVCRHCSVIYMEQSPAALPLNDVGDPYRPTPQVSALERAARLWAQEQVARHAITRIPCSPTTRHSNKDSCAQGCGKALRHRESRGEFAVRWLAAIGIAGGGAFFIGPWALLPALFWMFVVWPACSAVAGQPRP